MLRKKASQATLLELTQPLYFFLLSLGNSEATTNSPFVAMPLNQNNTKELVELVLFLSVCGGHITLVVLRRRLCELCRASGNWSGQVRSGQVRLG
jgi:hypothetical protein